MKALPEGLKAQCAQVIGLALISFTDFSHAPDEPSGACKDIEIHEISYR